MDQPVLLCVDGSELATAALEKGLHLLAEGITPVLVTVAAVEDQMAVAGTSGFAGGTMSPDEAELQEHLRLDEAEAALADAADALHLHDAEHRIERGSPGPAIVALAEQLGAVGIVMGTHGRGAIKRMVLGSVSDHVVRHAPCPVIVTTA